MAPAHPHATLVAVYPALFIKIKKGRKNQREERNKAGYTATKVAWGWAEATFEVTRPFGQEQ